MTNSTISLANPRNALLWPIIGCMMFVVTAVGCGQSGPKCIPVHGKITFDGGPCPAAGMITFSPVETPAGVPQRPGSGEFNKDGQYEINSGSHGDGLLPGRYRVRIDCLSGPPPQLPNGLDIVSYVARGFTPDELVVSTDANSIEANYDVPLKKK